MKRWQIAVLAVTLALFARLAFGISDMGNPAVTRLWVYDREGERRFACSASYVKGPVDYLWIVSAGHCSRAAVAGRDTTSYVFGSVDWRYITWNPTQDDLLSLDDLSLGTVPETRDGAHPVLQLAEAWPAEDTVVYIHGFPYGVERVCVALIVGPGEVYTKDECVEPGSSGSPILNGRGALVGIVWGQSRQDPRAVVATPVEAIRTAFKVLVK